VTYKIFFSKPAQRQLSSLPKIDLKKIAQKIEKLSSNPLPYGHEKMAGMNDCYRIRQGDYRILYTTQDKELIVLVLKIGHRREVYR
jgi:mRNA interferase RelE/StbE